LGVNIEVTEGEELDSVLSTTKTPAILSVAPVHKNLGWLLAAAALLLLVVTLITHN
jgi:hypothetical protein